MPTVWIQAIRYFCLCFYVAYETTLAEGIHFEKTIFYSTFATVSFFCNTVIELLSQPY